MEENDKQINEKQIHSCSAHRLARPSTGQSWLSFPRLSALKSDSFHNGISTLVTESCTHTKGTQMKETCGGKTEREILSFHAYLVAVGKSLLAKHSWNLELISGSILKVTPTTITVLVPLLPVLHKISWLTKPSSAQCSHIPPLIPFILACHLSHPF